MKRDVVVYGAALGATLMYLFDPDRGRYRRAVVRDKTAGALHRLENAFSMALRDLQNRTSGVIAELSSELRMGPVVDDVLERRIRSEMGRVVSHPKAIKVTAHGGHVTLSGAVLAHEYKALYRCVRSVHGVTEVDDQLEAHDVSENIPQLQGGVLRRRVRPDILQENWAPATRLIAGTTGSTLAVNALRHRSPWNTVLGLAGSALFLRAMSHGTHRHVSSGGAMSRH